MAQSGFAANTVLNRDGVLSVSSGGTATIEFNPFGYGEVISAAGASVTYLERDASVYYLQNGVLNKGAELTNFTVANTDAAVLFDGGVARTMSVEGGGRLLISSGGRATGALNISEGAEVFAAEGGIVDFDISGVSSGDAARVNNLSLIQGAPDYTVTVSDAQTEGSYSLADGASGFDRKVMVTNADRGALGAVVSGDAVIKDGSLYSLLNDGSDLSLYVEDVSAAAYAHSLTESDNADSGVGRAARWTSDTDIGSGTLNVVSSNFDGNAYLEIDGAEVAGALYGASCDYSGTINIVAGSGSIRNLAAGATDGGSVGAVNLSFEGANLDGVAYAGGFGNVAGEVNTVITSGTFAKDFYAGSLARRNVEETGIGDVTLTIDDGEFGGNIYGASAVKTVAGRDGIRHTAGDVTLTVTGGETVKGDQACIFAGGYATGNAAGTVYTVDSVTATVSGGSWGAAANGRGVFCGIMVSGVTAEVIGDVELTVSGGKMGNIYGGGWAQNGGVSTVGDVYLTITGDAEVASVFGSGYHSVSGGTTFVGNACITVAGGNITRAIYAKGQLDSDVVSDATVTFTGSNAYTCSVYGYSQVGGEGNSEALTLADFTGSFAGNIGGFNVIEFFDDTAMTLTAAANDVSNSDWMFDVSARDEALAATALLDWSAADFTDDTITLNLATDSGCEWALVDAASSTNYGNFDVLVDGESIVSDSLSLNEAIDGGAYDGWGFTLEGSVLKFKQLA